MADMMKGTTDANGNVRNVSTKTITNFVIFIRKKIAKYMKGICILSLHLSSIYSLSLLLYSDSPLLSLLSLTTLSFLYHSFLPLYILLLEHFVKFGGEGEIVEVDEAQFGTTQKNSVGRQTKDTAKMVLLMKHRKSTTWAAIHTNKNKRDALTIGAILPIYQTFPILFVFLINFFFYIYKICAK
jgi:hypothetical protein